MDSHTVCSFQKYFRYLVTDALDIEDSFIGDDNIVVEIDETRLGKGKCTMDIM